MITSSSNWANAILVLFWLSICVLSLIANDFIPEKVHCSFSVYISTWQHMLGEQAVAFFRVFLLFQRHNGEVSSGGSVKHLGRNRFAVSFQLEDVQKPEQDLYRCVTQSSRGSGVSNFAELIVKGKELVFFLSFVLSVFVLLPIMCTSQDNGILAKSMSLYSFFLLQPCILTSYAPLS